jgi:hypothetical protein
MANTSQTKLPYTQDPVQCAENAFRHAFLARNTLIHGERAEAFLELASLLSNTFQPTDEHERILVDTLTISMWRRTRALAIESAGLSFIFDKQIPVSSHPNSRTIAFQALVANPEQQRILDLMHRYEIRHTRAYDRAYKSLMAYRKMRKTDPDLFPQPDPEPDATETQNLPFEPGPAPNATPGQSQPKADPAPASPQPESPEQVPATPILPFEPEPAPFPVASSPNRQPQPPPGATSHNGASPGQNEATE